MRYYSIAISDPGSGQVLSPPGFAGLLPGATYASYANGRTMPNAWNVVLDVPVSEFASPYGSAFCRVWGVSRQEISQANDLNGKNVTISAGMQKGLPLANPAQAGVIVQGFIFQAFGNWIGVDQTLDLIISPGPAPSASVAGGTGSPAAPKNIVLNWKAGQKLSTAIQTALQTAFPGFQQSVQISDNLVMASDDVGYFQSVAELSTYVKAASKNIIKTQGYAGVSVSLNQKNFSIFDGTKRGSAATEISYQDLIGQPTWIESPLIQCKTVMRADLAVGGTIKLPNTLRTITAAAFSSLDQPRLSFQGEFTISSLRHVGNFRQADAASWVTVIEAYPSQASGG